MGQEMSDACGMCAVNEDPVIERRAELKGPAIYSKPPPGYHDDEEGFFSLPPEFAPRPNQADDDGHFDRGRDDYDRGYVDHREPRPAYGQPAPPLSSMPASSTSSVPTIPAQSSGSRSREHHSRDRDGSPSAGRPSPAGHASSHGPSSSSHGGSSSSRHGGGILHAAAEAASGAASAVGSAAVGAASAVGLTSNNSTDLEVILADLESAEAAAYSGAFSTLARGAGSVQPDNQQLRDFVRNHTSITADEDLDMQLIMLANNDSFSIDSASFMQLLREHSMNESAALDQFISQSNGGEPIPAMECRTGLLNFMQHSLNARFTDVQYQRIFDTVMVGVGFQVDMEQWIALCKKVGRITRLATYLKI
mmetsp:Transcript_57980/g.131080  ORF Transcript_57980/g.131080 Transcript_57980/m.131080 type:complete len:364 (+) Transcript_57980:105-1196(+)